MSHNNYQLVKKVTSSVNEKPKVSEILDEIPNLTSILSSKSTKRDSNSVLNLKLDFLTKNHIVQVPQKLKEKAHHKYLKIFQEIHKNTLNKVFVPSKIKTRNRVISLGESSIENAEHEFLK